MTPAAARLTAAAAAMNKGSAAEWARFVDAFSDYADRACSDLVGASPDRLSVVQGRAQMAVEILQLLRQAPGIMTKIEKTRTPK